jgi:PIN domain
MAVLGYQAARQARRLRRRLRGRDLVQATWPDTVITLIVPIIVMDELDSLKDRAPSPHAKWRAAYTLAFFDRIFTKPGAQGILQQPAADRRGILADIFFDPPRHERLPIADDEIIDRALAAQGLTGTTVTLLTFDTSQAARARNAGLDVNKLSKPFGEEPEDTRKKKDQDTAAQLYDTAESSLSK